MSLLIDLTGQHFGRLTVIKRNGYKGKEVACDCMCLCGTKKNISGRCLRVGDVKSCGCLNKELTSQRKLKHGMSKTRTHRIWVGIKARCHNPNEPAYKWYGARGIKVCERWMIFENFLSDMGICPDGYEIDRIDNDGDYAPSNCKWSTRTEQCNNRRSNTIINYMGASKTIAQWATSTGLRYGLIMRRLEMGWSVNRTLSTPVGGVSCQSGQ